jgi:hypothetical protein
MNSEDWLLLGHHKKKEIEKEDEIKAGGWEVQESLNLGNQQLHWVHKLQCPWYKELATFTPPIIVTFYSDSVISKVNGS